MGLFNSDQIAAINKVAEKSKKIAEPVSSVKSTGLSDELASMSQKVTEYFRDSEAILITSESELIEYIDSCIEFGYAGIDTETTGLDRINDTIVGMSLYVPGRPECYIPMQHLVPIFDVPYSNQLTYDQVSRCIERLADSDVKLIFANADFDLSMIYKDLKVDLTDVFYYDVILAWRVIKEDERDNSLKGLYNKYVLRGKGDPMKFRDFFTPKLFPYSKPDVAKLYAANDAKITYDLFRWQLPYVTKSNDKCINHGLQAISDIVWGLEFPVVKICQSMHRTGIYLDKVVAAKLSERYNFEMDTELHKLQDMVEAEILKSSNKPQSGKRPFLRGQDFNPNSPVHVKYLIYDMMDVPKGENGTSTDKNVLADINLPITNQILKVRSLGVLINTFVDKLPKATTPDSRIHAQFKQIGAATGRMSCISEGSYVACADGPTPIESVTPGTLVYCLDDGLSLILSEVEVAKQTGYEKCIEISFRDEHGSTTFLECTSEHPVRIFDGSWVRADELKLGCQVMSIYECYDNSSPFDVSDKYTVVDVNYDIGYHNVYDLQIKGVHNFYVNGINVHNSAEPNMQNIPSHAADIRHMFRATPGYVMLSSDYSKQEPAITAFISQDKSMIEAFKTGKDIYASIAALAFKVPYEECLEFHPDTHEYQSDGKARRDQAKTILLGITYGRSVPSIADQLYGTRDDMSDELKVKEAQKVYDSVLNAFPGLRQAMASAQSSAKRRGYTETILGRRRHLPDMQLPEFEFKAMQGYVNPDVDPLDPDTFNNKSGIPDRVQNQLLAEFAKYKYFGQVSKRIRELYEYDQIKVVSNRPKINDATRQCLNGVVQGSAADMTKIAMLKIFNNPDWNAIGGRLLVPVHDEIIAEVPMDKWKEGGEILSKTMIDAASFLPFSMTCDVTTTLRWYGLKYPCPYTQPDSLSNLSEDNIKWIQYMIHEMEYVLPVFKNLDGSKPRGDAALGVNGVWSDDLEWAIKDYMNRYKLQTDVEFISHIYSTVVYGGQNEIHN